MVRAAQVWLCLSLIAAATVGGCAKNTPQPGIAMTGENPFIPTRLRIYPLTHLDQDEEGKPIIVCHIEFKDVWGDSVKGAGQLQIQLYRSQETSQIQELRWDVDLTDLAMNAVLYDSITRTYRVRLGSLPQWVNDITTGQAKGRITLRAILTLKAKNGSDVYLQDEYIIEK